MASSSEKAKKRAGEGLAAGSIKSPSPSLSRRERGQKDAAFTLVELMVALLILAVGVALVHGVGGSVVEGSRNRETRAIQRVVREAMAAYGDANADFPTAAGGPESSAVLLEHLRRCKPCEPALRRLPRIATYEDATGRVHLVDAFGSPMLYYHDEKELVGRPPMLISHGADRDDLSDDIVTDLN